MILDLTSSCDCRLRLELFDNQYLLVDLGLVFPLVLLMPATHPRKELTHGRPEGNLLTFPILISVYGQSVFIMAFQVIAQVYLEQQVGPITLKNLDPFIF